MKIAGLGDRHMGGIFSKPKKPKPPPPPVAPPPPPTVEGTGVEDAARRKRRGARGRRGTFLTGDLVPETGRASALG